MKSCECWCQPNYSEKSAVKSVEKNSHKTKKSVSDEQKSFSKPSNRNLIKSNKQSVPLVRYSGPFLKWTREELKQMDQKTRKLITMLRALHPRNDINKLYVSRYLDMSTRRQHKKERRNTNYSDQKQQNNTEINRTSMTRKKNGKKSNCIDISSDKRNLTWEDLDMAKKREILKENVF